MPIDSLAGMRTLRSFVNKEVPSRVVATSREIAKFALEKAIQLSPIETGRFMASWRVTLSPALTTPASPGSRSASSAAAEALSQSDSALRSLKFGQPFFIVNDVPYSPYVEYGTPKVEPHYITRRVAMSIGGKFGRI